MATKLTTPQKSHRTLQGSDTNEGRQGKRLVKTPRKDAKQQKGDRTRKGMGR
jgi:hypothetical protein